MSDEFPDRGDGAPATTSFQEWLDQQAASQDVSREELLERLISSYWTLNEMVQLLDDSGGSGGADGDRSRSRGDDIDTTPTVGRDRGPDSSSRPPTDRAPGERDRSARGPDAAPEAGPAEAGDPTAATPSDDVVPERLDELGDRVDALRTELDREVERGRSLDEFAETVADRLTRIESDLDDLASDSESARESLADEQDSLAAEQERLRERLDSEFDSLRTILEYLLARSDELDAQLSSAATRREEELAQLRAERESLQSLKREAADRGTRAGECESCGERIDVDLLERPHCPHCGASLSGVEARTKWLFLSEYVVTTDEGTAAERTSTLEAERTSTPDPAETADGTNRAARTPSRRERDAPESSFEFGDVRAPPSAASPPNGGSDDDRGAGGDGNGGHGEDGTGGAAGSTSESSPFGDLEDLERRERGGDR